MSHNPNCSSLQIICLVFFPFDHQKGYPCDPFDTLYSKSALQPLTYILSHPTLSLSIHNIYSLQLLPIYTNPQTNPSTNTHNPLQSRCIQIQTTCIQSALVNKGNVLFNAGDYEKAREYYAEALSNDYSCIEAQYNVG